MKKQIARARGLWWPALAGLACGGAATSGTGPQAPPASGPPTNHVVLVGGQEPDVDATLFEALDLLETGRCREAVDGPLTQVLDAFERSYDRDETVVVCSRDQGMGMIQGLLSIPLDGSGPANSVVLGPAWSDALFLEGWCLSELGDLAGAEKSLQEALSLMADDPVYLCELGHVGQLKQDWEGSLEVFRRAVEAADVFVRLAETHDGPGAAAPATLFGRTPLQWQTRARRGVGFSLVELGRLDEAEQVYREVLALDPTDEQATRELALIEQLRGAGR